MHILIKYFLFSDIAGRAHLRQLSVAAKRQGLAGRQRVGEQQVAGAQLQEESEQQGVHTGRLGQLLGGDEEDHRRKG